MKIIRKFQLFDLILQAILLIIVTLPLILILVTGDSGLLLLSFMGLFPLGVWQLLSALMLAAGKGDKIRRIYLITAIAFSSLFFIAGMLADRLDLGQDFYKVFTIGLTVSYIAAIYYFSYSFRDYRAGNNPENNQEFV